MSANTSLPADGGYNFDQNAKSMLAGLLSHINQTEGATLPAIASVDLHYIHDLQRKRLEGKQAQIRRRYSQQKTPVSGCTWRMDNDLRYIARIPFNVLDAQIEYWVNGRLKKRIEEKQNFYAYIVWLRGQNADAPYVCPNCGAATMVSALVQGCPYCGTRFLMQELFPKITHYYTTMSPSTLIRNIKPCIIGGVVTGIAISVASGISSLGSQSPSSLPYFLISHLFSLVAAGVAGAMLGYVAFAFFTLAKIFYEAIASIPKLIAYFHVKDTLPVFMRQFEPSFSLDYFICKMFALIGILGYSDDWSDCALYDGDLTEAQKAYSPDLIDIRYSGGLKCNKYWVENDCAHIDLTVQMDNIYCRNGSISHKKEKFRLLMCKNIHAENDYGFSIHAVTCPGCGGSFDAVRVKHCPFCGREYNLKDHDWVVLKFKKQ